MADREGRIEALRLDPDFLRLVQILKAQTPEQIQRFYEHYETSERKTEGASDEQESKPCNNESPEEGL